MALVVCFLRARKKESQQRRVSLKQRARSVFYSSACAWVLMKTTSIITISCLEKPWLLSITMVTLQCFAFLCNQPACCRPMLPTLAFCLSMCLLAPSPSVAKPNTPPDVAGAKRASTLLLLLLLANVKWISLNSRRPRASAQPPLKPSTKFAWAKRTKVLELMQAHFDSYYLVVI